MIKSSSIQAVKNRLDIVTVINHFIKLDSHNKARCPFHEEKSPSFSVDGKKKFLNASVAVKAAMRSPCDETWKLQFHWSSWKDRSNQLHHFRTAGMKWDDLFRIVEMLIMQLREEEENYNEMLKHKVESAELKNITQRINSLKRPPVFTSKKYWVAQRPNNILMSTVISFRISK
jgi:hypothetical protein